MNTPAYLKFYGKDLFIFTATLKKSEKAAIFDGIIHLNMYGFWPENIKILCEKNENFSKNFQKIEELFSKSLENYTKICERNSQNAKAKTAKNKDNSNPLATHSLREKKETEAETETETKETIKGVDGFTKLEPGLYVAPFQKPQTIENAVFDLFWSAYPKQRAGAKDKARSAFNAAMKRHKGLTGMQLVESARKYANSDEVARGYAKGAQAWLNDDRFLQDYKPAGASTQGNPNALQEARERGNAIIERMFGGPEK